MMLQKKEYNNLIRMSKKGRKEDKSSILEIEDGVKIKVRHNIWDIKIVEEQFVKKNYFNSLELSNINPKTILDIGGYIGDFSLYCANKYNSIIHSYEPTYENLKLFIENLELNPNLKNNITLFDEAISSYNGDINLFFDNDLGEIHASTVFNYSKKKKVKCIDLETAIGRFNCDLDLVKIDIEGAEIDVLKSFKNEECINKVKYIVVENHDFKPNSNVIKNIIHKNFKLINEYESIETYKNINY
jgi:FkbM family methyltransferase